MLTISEAFGDSISQPQKRLLPHATVFAPSLYPVYLPFKTQHKLLIKVQDLLEKACYSFGQKTMRDVLEKEGWDCPECGELNRWATILLSNENKFSSESIDELGKPFSQLLDTIAHVRHTAVHRLRVRVNRIEEFMVDSESLARLLQEDTCALALSRLRRETLLTIDELKRNKDLLESRLAETLKRTAAQKAELERIEHMAVEDMLREDREYQFLASINLEQAITSPETVVRSLATTDNERGV